MRKRTASDNQSQQNQQSGWANAVVYQIYPRSFNEVRPDGEPHRGEGSLAGITAKLGYLSDLGVDALWLSPFYPSPMVDSGYDITNYTEVHARYGNLRDFKKLVAQAHRRGIKIMIDFVPNHTSDQHPWFQESRQNRTNPKRDWYIWRDPDPDGSTPNNWASVFSGSQLEKRRSGELDIGEDESTPPLPAWTLDDKRQQYYQHTFAPEQPELNWHNPEVRAALKDVMRTWLDRGVDGFRVDAINHAGKDPYLRDEEYNEDYHEGEGNPYAQLQQYRSANYPYTMYRYLRELASVLHEPAYQSHDARLIFEAYVSETTRRKIDAVKPDAASTFNFASLGAPWDASVRQRQLKRYYHHLPENAIGNQVNGNHDNPRLASRLGPDAARVAAVINLTLPGMIFIYNGEEGGFTDVDIPLERLQDPLGFRDPERTPMLWNASQNAGFSSAPPDVLWLPIDPDYPAKNLAAQAQDPSSSLALYKALLHLRHTNPALQQGSFRPLSTNRKHVLAFARQHKTRAIIVAANFADEAVRTKISDPPSSSGKRLLSSTMETAHEPLIDLHTPLNLRPHEAIIIEATAPSS
jgi:alpha-glucosidase